MACSWLGQGGAHRSQPAAAAASFPPVPPLLRRCAQVVAALASSLQLCQEQAADTMWLLLELLQGAPDGRHADAAPARPSLPLPLIHASLKEQCMALKEQHARLRQHQVDRARGALPAIVRQLTEQLAGTQPHGSQEEQQASLAAQQAARAAAARLFQPVPSAWMLGQLEQNHMAGPRQQHQQHQQQAAQPVTASRTERAQGHKSLPPQPAAPKVHSEPQQPATPLTQTLSQPPESPARGRTGPLATSTLPSGDRGHAELWPAAAGNSAAGWPAAKLSPLECQVVQLLRSDPSIMLRFEKYFTNRAEAEAALATGAAATPAGCSAAGIYGEGAGS